MSADKEKVEVANAFKDGWDKAGREGSVTPQLKKALCDLHGIHPDRADQYMNALMASKVSRGPVPDPKDYIEPVVVPFAAPAPKP